MAALYGRRNVLAAIAAAPASLAIDPKSASSTYEDPADLYAALRTQPAATLPVSGGSIRLVFADGAPHLDRGPALEWIRRSAAAVTAYFGRFPVKEYGLLVIAEPGDTVGHATTFGHAGAATRIRVGTSAGQSSFARDWVLVHEMVHTALPDLPRRALWLQEGNATYVEPIARAMAGQISQSQMWSDALAGMPKGEPRDGDGGMDGTTAWRRLYWGGAIFWLEAEVAIFEQSEGRFLLRDALRAINRTSGGNGADWTPEQMMMVGDSATQTRALRALYGRFASRGIDDNLPRLLERLGLSRDPESGVRFDANAKLAGLTRRITMP